MNKNLFATVLTHAAPSSNYRGENEMNRSVLQKLTLPSGERHAVISSAAIRNAMREAIAELGLPCNRKRILSDQPAVKMEDLPNPEKYADDYLFGYMVAKPEWQAKMEHEPKRDSIIRVNMGVAIEPYQYEALLVQSPKQEGAWQNDSSSNLLQHEVNFTAYQWAFALAGSDCQEKPEWVSALLSAIAQLSGVAGNHARTYFDFSPRSIIVRSTPQLAPQFELYGWGNHGNHDVISRLNDNDLPGEEFWVGGEIVRRSPTLAKQLNNVGVKTYPNPAKMMDDLAQEFLGVTAAV